MKRTIPLFIAIFALPLCVIAHGDLHERIARTSRLIKSHPDSTALYFKRANLYYQHKEYNKALTDINTCIDQGLVDNDLWLLQSMVYKATNHLSLAREKINLAIEGDPYNVRYLRQRGKLLMAMEEACSAQQDFQLVIDKATGTFVENHLEIAEATWECGGPNRIPATLSYLDEAIQSLGPLLILHISKRDYSLKAGQLDKALTVQTEIIRLSSRKESPLLQRARMYLDKNDKTRAAEDLNAAKLAWAALPRRIQSTPAMQVLIKDVDQLMNEI